MKYEISANKDIPDIFFVMTRTDCNNICIFNKKGVYNSIEKLCISINENFHNHTYAIITIKLNFELICSFETLEEFQELMCEYLI
jgi:hypothetical protein